MDISPLPASVRELIAGFLSDCTNCARSPHSLCGLKKCPVCKDCERHNLSCDHCEIKVCVFCTETGDFSFCHGCQAFFCGKCISLRKCTECDDLFCLGCSAPRFDDDCTCNSCIREWEEREIRYMRTLEEEHRELSPSTMDYINQVQEMIALGHHNFDDEYAYEFDEEAYNNLT